MTRVASIGECMVEMRLTTAPAADDPASGGDYHMAFGGDTANTAVYLARLLEGSGHGVDYVTALGDDPYSDRLAQFLKSEGVGTQTIRRMPGRMPGLYFIRTDAAGERSFHYYRSAAAARHMFTAANGQALLAKLADHDWIYLSGITLSILDQPQRDALAETLKTSRAQGTRVAFDNNYRPAGWPNAEAARDAYAPILAQTDLALMTLDDEQALHPGTGAQDCISRLRAANIPEIAVKLGPQGCIIADAQSETEIPTTAIQRPVDTTAAGDSFNAAYLHARITGHPPAQAAEAGNALAAKVIMHQGAIIAR